MLTLWWGLSSWVRLVALRVVRSVAGIDLGSEGRNRVLLWLTLLKKPVHIGVNKIKSNNYVWRDTYLCIREIQYHRTRRTDQRETSYPTICLQFILNFNPICHQYYIASLSLLKWTTFASSICLSFLVLLPFLFTLLYIFPKLSI